ncbi:MAG: putative toxin-antitoxin system toxin component, PIN family [Solirubrobacteraceae bacterium]|nr:putative toxin-antitoxin system toxin component, PIN family [Solirubrobacteraceae bacterium]
MRAVLDVNVHVSALLSRGGAPAALLRLWLEGRFELLVSPLLLHELTRTLTYPKLRKRIAADQATDYVHLLARSATTCTDAPAEARFRSEDPADDYLIGLAASERALLVSGDAHLLALEAQLVPVYPPRAFLELLDVSAGR